VRQGGPLLFVYGTLMRGSRSPYAKLLRVRAQFVSEASARGYLYHLGRFPGAVFDARSPAWVHGEVFQLHTPSLLNALDAYEGCRPGDQKPQLFRREIIAVQLTRAGANAAPLAWTYSFTGGIARRPRIASGRFKAC
jgi:gamma-glutamylcyclotransferase (GGCT)/AIG2-like uncharacterized protein YtfP